MSKQGETPSGAKAAVCEAMQRGATLNGLEMKGQRGGVSFTLKQARRNAQHNNR